MSHEIHEIDGVAQYAFTGDRSEIWHGLGQQMPEGSTVDEMAGAAGLTFKYIETRPRFFTDSGSIDKMGTVDTHKILLHSRTKQPVGLVGAKFQVVQPEAMTRLARQITQVIDGAVDSCGVLFGGAGYWFNIHAGDSLQIVEGDRLDANLLLVTFNDGSMNTTCKASAIRSVCYNTVSAALGQQGKGWADFKLSHRLEFEPEKLAAYWATAYAKRQEQAQQFKLLSMVPVSHSTAERITFDVFNNQRPEKQRQHPDEPVPSGKVDIRNTEGYKMVLGMFSGTGRGATLKGVKGTAWGMLNAFTEYSDHHRYAKSASQRWINSNFGTGVDFKQAAFDRVMAEAE